MSGPNDFRELIPQFQVNKALGKQHRYKGFTAQYIGYLYMAFAGCFILGLGLNLIKLPVALAFPVPIALFLLAVSLIRGMQRKYGRHGWAKRRATLKAPHALRKQRTISQLLDGTKRSHPGL